MIYKALLRPCLDYGDTLYDQAANLHQKLESIQYCARLSITGSIRGIFREASA